MSKHPVVHIEISSKDRQESAEFYSNVFGWQMNNFEDMSYTTFSTGGEGEVGGGLNPVTDDNPAGTVIVYINTDDIEATLADIEAHGGQTVAPKMEIPNMGWFAFFKDPTGNTLALYKDMGMNQ